MPQNSHVRGNQGQAGHSQLLRELNEERAAALQRISTTLESLIRQLHASRERVRHASGVDREREIAAWRDLWARAVKYRWYLEVQREALGIRRHDAAERAGRGTLRAHHVRRLKTRRMPPAEAQSCRVAIALD